MQSPSATHAAIVYSKDKFRHLSIARWRLLQALAPEDIGGAQREKGYGERDVEKVGHCQSLLRNFNIGHPPARGDIGYLAASGWLKPKYRVRRLKKVSM